MSLFCTVALGMVVHTAGLPVTICEADTQQEVRGYNRDSIVKTCLQKLTEVVQWVEVLAVQARRPECTPRTLRVEAEIKLHKVVLRSPQSTYTPGRCFPSSNNALKPRGRGEESYPFKSFMQSRIVVKLTLWSSVSEALTS